MYHGNRLLLVVLLRDVEQAVEVKSVDTARLQQVRRSKMVFPRSREGRLI